MNPIPKYYRYTILFRGDIGPVSPILNVSNTEVKSLSRGRMHLFDETLLAILPAVKYCLHMPRVEMDTYDTDTEVLDRAHDVSHDLWVVPDSEPLIDHIISQSTLVVYADNCLEEIKIKAQKSAVELGAVSVSDLSQELLVAHWNQLFVNRAMKDSVKLKEIETQFLLNGEQQLVLPALFTARQYEKADQVYCKVFNTENAYKTSLEILWEQLVHHNALMSCEGFSGTDAADFSRCYKAGLEKATRTTRLNIVITMPGIPQQQIKLCGLNREVPDVEKRAIKLIGLHRAIAKNALLIELPLVENDLFHKLNELEVNCIQGTNNKYVKKTLRDIGRILEAKLTKEQLWAINWSKHITIFSDFPLGLAIIGDSDTSLQCYKEISYRPLSPLTRCFQTEMPKHKQLYFGAKCKIAFAECIPNDDPNLLIRTASNALVASIKQRCKENEKMQFTYAETLTVAALKEFLKENMDADIVHISGHGFYDRSINMAGLMVGKECWMGGDSDYRVPPVVVLSACHTSPRGSGTVNVADMFIRAGAEAVLGAFIPIDARRNMVLINRLYTYISEGLKGSKQYHTLSEAWSGIVATNAIHEMAATSTRFHNWIWGMNSKGTRRMMDFTMERSPGRLHASSMYKDTIEIVKEMLHEEGMDGKFADILDQENYFPESFFYQWIGFPENIFLYNDDIQKS